ncbi:ARM repeat superfamily protein [Striga hermonthica]|uniref:ARM repeat superfamily protein n=1 Tax=Striga hermonthica TaxID=68872 RepID=A0A9N7RC34_STRHE|nr:ARM repeat superfamily protein [Striga hermonthica]
MADGPSVGKNEAPIAAARGIGKLDGREKQKLIENGVLPVLVMMLHNQDYDSTEAALFALLNLAFGNERNKVRIVQAGAVAGMLDILQWRKSSLMELSLAGLSVLSTCSVNRMEIASLGAVRALIGILDSRLTVRQTISNRGMLHILSTLQNLSTCVKVVPSFVEAGGLITLVQLIYGVDNSSELAEKAMGLLETIVSSSEVALDQVSEVISMFVECVEEGSMACQEHAVGILLMICRRCRERHRGMILRHGAMPGLMQLSVDGTWAARDKAKALIDLLRDTSSSRGRDSHNAALEEVMRRIDMDDNLVEEMIAKLRTSTVEE